MRAVRFLFLACSGWSALPAQTLVTLSPATSPSAGQPGVTSINLTGNNFPAGTILPAGTTVTLNPASGTGTSATTAASAVTTILGTTRRVTFTIPSSIGVSGPTAYLASISGTTTTGTAFASSNQAALTINPVSAISLVSLNSGQQGQQNLVVIITGQFTNFVQGVTQANFGPGISVGGATAGTFGPVTVANSTTASATLNIAASASLGSRTVVAQTASELASLSNGFTVTAAGPVITQVSPAGGQQGQTLTGVTITGAFTHFMQAIPAVTFSSTGVTASVVSVIDDTHLTVTVTITAIAATGVSNIIVATGTETALGTGVFAVVGGGAPTITQVSPGNVQQGQTLTNVAIMGGSTHFTQATPTVAFSGTGVTATAVHVIDNTHLTVTLTIAANAATGPSSVTVVTGAETASGTGLFTVSSGTPVITSISPAGGRQGQTLTGVVITGSFTHFTQATPAVMFSTAGVMATLVKITDDTHLTVAVTIAATVVTGVSNVTVTTGAEVATGNGLFSVTATTPLITLVNPNMGQVGQPNLAIAITGQFTHFAQGTTMANFGPGITVTSTTVTDSTHATVSITIASNASPGTSTVIMTTGPEIVGIVNGFTITGGALPTISDFNPKSAPVGALVTVTGGNLQPNPGTSAQVTLAKQGGGTLAGPVSNTTPTVLSFVIPAGAATGALSVTVNGLSASATVPLTIVPSSTFSLSALPNPANLIQGQSTVYAVTLNTTTGFNQLAALSVSGIPSGLIATFNPPQITGGQTSVLTVTAPAGQATGSTPLTVSASAIVNGIAVVQSAAVTLNVQPVTTTLLGRTVVSDALETPLAGVTITMLGKDGNGNSTSCTGRTVSDGAGNFALTNLSAGCIGPQLVGYDGTTTTSPLGKYAGVNLVYAVVSGKVTPAPVLIHLPRIDNQETFLVQQNAPADQSYSWRSVPNLSVTVYAGTTFTMPDQTQPNPFPLTAINVPVDRLPDIKPPVPTMITAFIVAFQPANATANQPVAVYYPNELNEPPSMDMALLTLDPAHGAMVPYGTGAVSADGTQIVPDLDPAHPGHRYGLVHFDWHMPGYPPGNQLNPSPFSPVCCAGDPVDLSSGLEVINETDISFGGSRGTISLVRTYRNGISATATTFGPFGYGTNHNFGYELGVVAASTATVIPLIMPDGNQFPFSKQSTGVFVNSSGIPSMAGAVMTLENGTNNVDLRWKDGTIFRFIQISGIPVIRTLLDSITDRNGNKIQLVHNGFQISDIIDPVGRDLHFNYNVGGCITQITAPDSSFVSYDYGGGGLCTNAPQPNLVSVLRKVTHPDGSTTGYDYAPVVNNLTTVTDGRGFVIASNTYANPSIANNRVAQQRQANGGVLQFSYVYQNPTDPSFSPVLATTVTDALNHQTTYRFSPNGAVIGVTDALGQTRVFNRDGSNNIVSITGAANCAACGNSRTGDQSFSYDGSGNLLSQTDALGNTTSFTYDPTFNKITSIRDPLGNIAIFTYDSHGNLQSQRDPNGNVTQYRYDSFGELIQTTDPTNQTTFFSYDTLGNLVSIGDPLGNITSFQYDINGRLIATQDALARRTQIAYDKANRIISQTNAQNGITHFNYDQVGNLLGVTDARSNSTNFTYDLMDRLVNRTDPIGRTDTRTYDLNENVTQFKDRRGQTSTFTYDAANRLVGEAYQDGSTVARSYDANDRLSAVTDSAVGTFGFTFDAAGRLTNSTTPFGAVDYIRDGLGRATARQVVGKAPVTYAYDKAGNLVSAATPAAGVTRTYDARNLLATANRMNGVSSQYTHDQLRRLVSLTHSGPGGILNSQTYSYDAVGNRMSATNSIAQSLVTQPVTPTLYDADNEQNQFGPTANSFDANGNLVSSTTSGVNIAYTWDSRGRLAAGSTSTGQTTRFLYDFAGNLMQQADTGPTANVNQTFLLDDLTNVAYVNRSDGDEYSVLAGQSIDDHLGVVHGNGQIEYGLADGVNSTVVTADEAGAVKGRFAYEPFGQTAATNSSYPFQYAGRVPISTNLYYYRARFYNSQTGRFISEDPIGFGGGDANFYRYVNNDPENLTDPNGLLSIPGCIIGIICIPVIYPGPRPPVNVPGSPIPIPGPAIPGKGGLGKPGQGKPSPSPCPPGGEKPLPGPGGGQEPEPPEIPIPSPSFSPTPLRPAVLLPFPISLGGPGFHF